MGEKEPVNEKEEPVQEKDGYSEIIQSTNMETGANDIEHKDTAMSLASSKVSDGGAPTEISALLNNDGELPTEPESTSKSCTQMRNLCACPPQGYLSLTVTNVLMVFLVWGVVWSITGAECLPGGNLFGILALLLCAVIGGKLVSLIRIPTLPPLPELLANYTPEEIDHLLHFEISTPQLVVHVIPLEPEVLTGSRTWMLLAGFLIRNIPYVTDQVQINYKWSAALRNLALAIILTRAGLGLDPKALRKLKTVCLRLSLGPCAIEAAAAAVVSHFLMGLPMTWGFMLGFILGAVSPAVVVPSMLILQKGGFGVDKGIPTLLMAAGSFDDILAITGFNTCLGMALSSGSTINSIVRGVLEVVVGIVAGLVLGFFLKYFPSKDQEKITWRRAYLLLALSIFAVFGSLFFGFPGSGGLCTLVMAFLAGMGWSTDKAVVEDIVAVGWDIFQPLLFGLIGAEISVTLLKPQTVGLCIATVVIALLIRICFTFVMVCFAGFNMKEKIFISLAWMPKATVQAAIGSVALDTARSKGYKQFEGYGMDLLTVAFLGILVTAPIGAIIIGLMGPKLLQKSNLNGEVEEIAGERDSRMV